LISKSEDTMKYEYKVASFGCTFSSRTKFNTQLQELLNKYAEEGWMLHSFKVSLGDTCIVVFYREVV